MEKVTRYTLAQIADEIFSEIRATMVRMRSDLGVDISLLGGFAQETIAMRLADSSFMSIKVFPHRNFQSQNVFRVEVYKTIPGDMRGNRITFVEISQEGTDPEDIRKFTEGVLSRSGII
ncbi:MAG TPA: hypothetical protein PKO06_13615 [Candidatus Ozemobacteraceae bacterium]|nr:hypothetical protein [Candidatus Ozemobacteraceae bacterium]